MRQNPPSPLRVQQLFDAALELAPGRRAAFLDEACREDPELRRAVGDLLAVLDRAHTDELFPALTDTPRGLLAFGERIGPYRVLHELGAGGMGVVFLAEREDVEKRVALKLVREGGLASGDRVRRFLQERRVLARLEHPNIAQLLDAGVTEMRLPYFAMEYVAGTPIDRYCDERRLSIPERLGLFRTVCEAVQYAHQNLVVHRDLKPSNILVTADGQVKLLDFGIAKLLAPNEQADAEDPGTGLLMLTPEFASPEQVRGEPVTTASDVYSLGVVLYQLLAGHRPYRFDSRTPSEVERVVCRELPDRPSDMVTRTVTGAKVPSTHAAVTPEWVGRARNTSPERLRRRLSGDLDTIVLKALSKEPARRYLSAAQLSDDVRRHLVGLPVLARRDTAAYRTGKFLQRHKVGVTVAALLLMTLLGGVVATAWQARRADAQRVVAEQRSHDVHALATTILFELHDSIAHLPGTTRARAVVVGRALDYLRQLTAQNAGDRELQRESAEAYIRLGVAQGYPTGANLGDLEGARTSLTEALSIATRLVESDPDDLRARRTLALAQEKFGDVMAWIGEVPGAVDHAREALGHWTRLADAQPDKPGARLSVAISTIKLGDLLGHPAFPNAGDRAGAEAQYRRALAILAEYRPDSTREWNWRRQIALGQERLGAMLQLGGRLDEALGAIERSLELRTRLAEDDRSSSEAERDVAVSRENLCQIQLERRDLDAAMSHCMAAVGLYRELRENDPGNAQGITDLAIAESGLAQVLSDRGQWSSALAELERSRGLLRESLRANAENLRAGRELARNMLRAGILNARLSTLAVGNRRRSLLAEADSFHATGRKAMAESIRRLATADDESDLKLVGEAEAQISRAAKEVR